VDDGPACGRPQDDLSRSWSKKGPARDTPSRKCLISDGLHVLDEWQRRACGQHRTAAPPAQHRTAAPQGSTERRGMNGRRRDRSGTSACPRAGVRWQWGQAEGRRGRGAAGRPVTGLERPRLFTRGCESAHHLGATHCYVQPLLHGWIRTTTTLWAVTIRGRRYSGQSRTDSRCSRSR
jgi:hypothetical protein